MKTIKKILSFLPLLFIALIACSQTVNQTVNVVEFNKGLSADVQVLDVRTPEEFNQGHLKEAMLADWNNQEEFIRRVAALEKDKPVYLYCLSGTRSAAATKYMKGQGFDVVELKGGIKAWKDAEYPLMGEKEVAEISEKSYREMLDSASLVLVDFGAEWCPPCRKMKPILEEVEEENPSLSLIHIDGGSQGKLMKEFSVSQLPTYVLYKDGKEVWRTVGLTEKKVLNQTITRFKD